MDQPKLSDSRFTRGILIGLVAALLLLGIFQLGVMVGSHKAGFACKWNERNGERPGLPFPGANRFAPPLPGFLDPNGADGNIVSINGQQIIMKGKDGIEKTIVVTPDTQIRAGRDSLSLSDIKPDDYAVVFGSPTSTGQMEAKVIHIQEPGVPQGQNNQ